MSNSDPYFYAALNTTEQKLNIDFKQTKKKSKCLWATITLQIHAVPPTRRFSPTSPPTGRRAALYQSQAHTCSGNDAELIAFNPDAADNLEASSLRQRRARSMQEWEGGKREDTRGDGEGRQSSRQENRQKADTQEVENKGMSSKTWGRFSETPFFIFHWLVLLEEAKYGEHLFTASVKKRALQIVF